MKKIYFCLLIATPILRTHSQTVFTRYYSSISYGVHDVNTCFESSDNAIIVGGDIPGNNLTYSANFIAKITSDGDTIWSRALGYKDGYNSNDYLHKIIETRDSSYLVLCENNYCQMSGCYSRGFLLEKFNKQGSLIWKQRYINNNFWGAMDLVELADSSLICMSNSYYDLTPDTFRILFTHLDQNGNVLSNKIFGSDVQFSGFKLLYTNDHSFLVFGTTADLGIDSIYGPNRILIMKIDSSLNLLWNRRYKLLSHRIGRFFRKQLLELPDNTFLVSSGVSPPSGSGSGSLIYKIDTMGFPTIVKGIDSLFIGDFCLGADTSLFLSASGYYASQGFILNCDENLNIIKSRFLYDSFNISTINSTSDNGFLLAFGGDFLQSSFGIIRSDSLFDQNCFSYDSLISTTSLNLVTDSINLFIDSIQTMNFSLMNTDEFSFSLDSIADPCNIMNVNEANAESARFDFEIYPNPTSGKIKISHPQSSIDKIEIYNLMGEKMMETSLSEIDISSFPSGIYIIQVNSGEKHLRGKVIKQ